MQPAAQHKMAYAKKSHLSPLLTIVSVGLIIAGVIGLILVQQPLKKSQETRQQASVATGTVLIAATPSASPSTDTFVVGQPGAAILSVNTQGLQTDGVQLTFNIVTDTFDVPTVEVLSSSGLTALSQEVQTTSDGYLVTLLATPQLGQPFSTTSPVYFAKVYFTPLRAGTIQFNFDADNSISTVYHSNPVTDELKSIPSATFYVVDANGASPTPSPTPTPTPSVSPTPTPTPSASPTPTPTPSVSPSPTPTPGTGGGTIKQCNDSCTSNAECDVNLRCYNNQCRLAINPSSSSCSQPADQGLSFGCNHYCADSRECAGGYSCLENKCRRADNPDSTSCVAPSTTTQQTTAASCGKSCSSNAQCAINLRCYQGACRLATNPSSMSCSAATSSTVSDLYSQPKGGNASEQSNPAAASVGGVVHVSPRPSASPSPSPSVSPKPTGNTLLDTFRNLPPLRRWAIIALGLGLLILVLIIISSLRRRRSTPSYGPLSSSPTTRPTDQNEAKYEQELQAKLEALKQQQPSQEPMSPPPSTLTTAPPEPRPVNMPPITPPTIARPEPQPGMPIFEQNPAQAPADRPASTMMERIREKGINPPDSNP